MTEGRRVACIFRSVRTDHSSQEYARWSERIDRLVKSMPGYEGHESFREESTGRGVTISYFNDMTALSQWRVHPIHREAQALGRSHFYDEYEIEVVEIVRQYSWRLES